MSSSLVESSSLFGFSVGRSSRGAGGSDGPITRARFPVLFGLPGRDDGLGGSRASTAS